MSRTAVVRETRTYKGELMSGITRKGRRLSTVLVGTGVAVVAVASVAGARVEPGTPGKDVTFGSDNDNANNTFIQPPGVAAKQHMDNTDVVFGRANDDLLVGNLGGDTVVAGSGDDILVGGPERGTAPNSDVLLGDRGNDINLWQGGDGSEVFVGDRGRHDTMVFAPFVTRPDGSLKLEWNHGRRIPRVDIGGQPAFSCDIVKVPRRQHLGAQFLVRFSVNGTLAVTVRQKDVERVLCPAPHEGRARTADLTDAHPNFRGVRLNHIGGTLGAIVARPH